MKPFISVQNLRFSYDSESGDGCEVLSDINLDIEKGEFVSILGHNGCGKSTLAKHFNAILLPSGGKIFVDGRDTQIKSNVYDIRKKIGLILQNPDNQLVASIVEEEVAFGPENLCLDPGEIKKRVSESLKLVDMYDYRDKLVYKLSGGQKQRVAIAGIIAMQPNCIVLDEPTSMLDPEGRDEVINTILRLNREKKITIILITHFMEEAILSDRVIVMSKGKILSQGTPREIFSDVEKLRRNNLDVPQSSELIYELNKHNLNLKRDVITEEECVEQIVDLLEKYYDN